jgi:hypothetical protein
MEEQAERKVMGGHFILRVGGEQHSFRFPHLAVRPFYKNSMQVKSIE